jgi:hypothetical protein
MRAGDAATSEASAANLNGLADGERRSLRNKGADQSRLRPRGDASDVDISRFERCDIAEGPRIKTLTRAARRRSAFKEVIMIFYLVNFYP